jgi:hypothetical protein
MPDNEPAHSEARGCPRLSPKYATHVEVFRTPDGLGPNVATAVLDVSSTGARLVLTECLPAGHVIGVALYGLTSLLPMACAATVIWSRQNGEGSYVTGVRFNKSAGEENLASVASTPTSPR